MVFVTGATGLLGSHLFCRLAASGEEIITRKESQCLVDPTPLSF